MDIASRRSSHANSSLKGQNQVGRHAPGRVQPLGADREIEEKLAGAGRTIRHTSSAKPCTSSNLSAPKGRRYLNGIGRRPISRQRAAMSARPCWMPSGGRLYPLACRATTHGILGRSPPMSTGNFSCNGFGFERCVIEPVMLALKCCPSLGKQRLHDLQRFVQHFHAISW